MLSVSTAGALHTPLAAVPLRRPKAVLLSDGVGADDIPVARLKNECSRLANDSSQLKTRSVDGKNYLMDVADIELFLRVIQSIPAKSEVLQLMTVLGGLRGGVKKPNRQGRAGHRRTNILLFPSLFAGDGLGDGKKYIVAVDPRYLFSTEIETLLGASGTKKVPVGRRTFQN